jgi:hypothetical protein
MLHDFEDTAFWQQDIALHVPLYVVLAMHAPDRFNPGLALRHPDTRDNESRPMAVRAVKRLGHPGLKLAEGLEAEAGGLQPDEPMDTTAGTEYWHEEGGGDDAGRTRNDSAHRRCERYLDHLEREGLPPGETAPETLYAGGRGCPGLSLRGPIDVGEGGAAAAAHAHRGAAAGDSGAIGGVKISYAARKLTGISRRGVSSPFAG